jgi:hypothetical protein
VRRFPENFTSNKEIIRNCVFLLKFFPAKFDIRSKRFDISITQELWILLVSSIGSVSGEAPWPWEKDLCVSCT